VDAIIDAISPQNATAGLSHLAFGGHLVCVAGLPNFSRVAPFTQAVSVHEIALGPAYGPKGTAAAVADLGQMLRELLDLVAWREVDAFLWEMVPLSAAAEALARLKQGAVRGEDCKDSWKAPCSDGGDAGTAQPGLVTL
jgi:D-arabinose 1-dehydrogenase-like Zn-dependent alcohol dehydrogenase